MGSRKTKEKEEQEKAKIEKGLELVLIQLKESEKMARDREVPKQVR